MATRRPVLAGAAALVFATACGGGGTPDHAGNDEDRPPPVDIHIDQEIGVDTGE